MHGSDAGYAEDIRAVCRDQLQHGAIALPSQNKIFIAGQTGDLLRASVSQWWWFSSVEIAAAQEEAAGLAHHLAA
jgi:hypothetical protein